ncbi:hypothetical protein SAMN05414139_10823 [Burkholderia sp. D7]|nr:hypothetical protein SAMN05414139_10823 [Burkholderia sp. D7]
MLYFIYSASTSAHLTYDEIVVARVVRGTVEPDDASRQRPQGRLKRDRPG